MSARWTLHAIISSQGRKDDIQFQAVTLHVVIHDAIIHHVIVCDVITIDVIACEGIPRTAGSRQPPILEV